MNNTPVVIYNPQRPEAGFTRQDDGTYVSAVGDTIDWPSLRTYVISGFSSLPSAADIKTAQAALGLTQSGQLDDDTMSGVSILQQTYNLLPTGVPDGATLAKIKSVLAGAGNTNASGQPKPNWTPAILALAFVVVIELIEG
jgi:hypothetical protein